MGRIFCLILLGWVDRKVNVDLVKDGGFGLHIFPLSFYFVVNILDVNILEKQLSEGTNWSR